VPSDEQHFSSIPTIIRLSATTEKRNSFTVSHFKTRKVEQQDKKEFQLWHGRRNHKIDSLIVSKNLSKTSIIG
jgi:hypothetical protein